ncbi:MAG: nucleoside triphosphate pyrophosphohydrolase family protein [Bacteroidia bacterium]|nr:nucleoside triphosphate pyrophosphohydrolase family protein [Bacteroidia bacterium]
MEDLQAHIEKVKTFQKTFDLIVNEEPTATVPKDLYLLRYKLMREENEEYLEACEKGDLVEIADALGDKLYILLGTIITHGLQHKIEEVFNEIQRSNMSKLDKEGNPVRRADGKILKSDQYFKPDLRAILYKEEMNNQI